MERSHLSGAKTEELSYTWAKKGSTEISRHLLKSKFEGFFFWMQRFTIAVLQNCLESILDYLSDNLHGVPDGTNKTSAIQVVWNNLSKEVTLHLNPKGEEI